MPGIAGIVSLQRHENLEADLTLMVECMRHEANYVSGRYVNADMGLYLGWTSHPWSLAGRMPLVSSDGRVVLIVMGECFSSPQNPRAANGEGPADNSAQYLLQQYEQLGDKFFSGLNGWFCGVAIDLHHRTATLFNDRYGMGRVYFSEGAHEFLFASEAKAILKVRPACRAIEPTALASYLRSSCVTGNRSLFKGISLLPPASSWTFTANAVPQKGTYFHFKDWESQPTLDPEEFFHRFEETVSRVIPSYMEDEHPVGLSLTAGLDTRTILASTNGKARPLPCYTFGGPWGETFDISTARKLTELYGQPHQVIRMNDQFFRQFAGYAWKSVYISDGAHDVLGAHDVYFNEMARQIAPIRLTGKFGSEVVRTRKLIPSLTFPQNLLEPSFAPLVNEPPDSAWKSVHAHPLSRTVAQEIPWYEYGRVAVEQSKVTLRTPYMDNELVKLMFQAPQILRVSRDLQARYITEKSRRLSSLPTDLGSIVYGKPFAAWLAYLRSWVFFKLEYTYLYAMPHWLTWVDRRLERLKPERILVGRHKFEAYRIWMRTYLSEFIQDTLLSPQAACTSFFDRAALAQAVKRHLAGTHNYMGEINRFLTVELICSSLLKAPGRPETT